MPDGEKELVLDLLASLFPGLHLQPGRTGVLGPFRQAARRVGDPEYFERYFALGVPIDDIADTVVARGLEDIASGRAGPARAKLEAVLLPVAQPDSALQTRTLCKLIKVSFEYPSGRGR